MSKEFSFSEQPTEFVEIMPLADGLMLGVTAERELYLINSTAEPKRATQLGLFTGYDTDVLKSQTTYVVHGGERHPNFH